MRTLIAALRFLTRLPVPGAATTTAELPGSLAWFPLVGAACGALVAGIFVALGQVWPPAVAAVLAIALGLLLTGGFHEDAVSDAADGLGGGTDRERVLAIMKDSRIGAYGAMTLWVVLGLRWAVLTSCAMGAGQIVLLFALAGAWGRWTAAPLLALPPLATAGLSKDLSHPTGRAPLAIATVLVLALSTGAWWLGLGLDRTLGMVLVALIATGIWALYLMRRLGGQSGDLLGAGNQLTEATALLVAMAL